MSGQQPKDTRSTASKVFDSILSAGYGFLWLILLIISVVGIFLPGTLWYGLVGTALFGWFTYRNFRTMFRP
jgi:hypothetical protein